MKRGQVSVYMIVGIILILVVIILFYFRDYVSEKISTEKQVEITAVPEQFKDIQKQIEDCTDNFVLSLVYTLGVDGGYLDRTDLKTINYLGTNITYLHYGKTNYVPLTTRMESELSNYINTLLPLNCRLTDPNININFDKITSIVDIRDKNIVLKIRWPITLTKGSLTSEISEINLNYPIRIGEIRNLVDVMVKQQIKDKPQLCLTCMARTAQENNLFVNTYNQNDSIIFVITDMNEQKDFEPYKFWYAGDYK